jgi:hypothetical protein
MRALPARAALFVVIAATATAPRGAGAADVPIQPGAQVSSSIGLCTLNFVFHDGTKKYVGTAGHCVERVGDRVTATGAGAFGTVVFRKDAGADDFALIQIDGDKLSLVSATVRGIGLPTGYTRSTQTAAGDLVQLSGYGIGFSLLPQTRTRTGVLAADNDRQYFAEIPALFGDSGGPLVHQATGHALGIVSGIGVTFPPSTLLGTTVERALALVQADGFNVSLLTS